MKQKEYPLAYEKMALIVGLICLITVASCVIVREEDRVSERSPAQPWSLGSSEPPYRKKCGGKRYCGEGYHCCDPWSCCPDGQHCCWDWRNPRCCVKPPVDNQGIVERSGTETLPLGSRHPPHNRKRCGGVRFCGPGLHCCDYFTCCPDGQYCCWDWVDPKCCTKPPNNNKVQN